MTLTYFLKCFMQRPRFYSTIVNFPKQVQYVVYYFRWPMLLFDVDIFPKLFLCNCLIWDFSTIGKNQLTRKTLRYGYHSLRRHKNYPVMYFHFFVQNIKAKFPVSFKHIADVKVSQISKWIKEQKSSKLHFAFPQYNLLCLRVSLSKKFCNIYLQMQLSQRTLSGYNALKYLTNFLRTNDRKHIKITDFHKRNDFMYKSRNLVHFYFDVKIT